MFLFRREKQIIKWPESWFDIKIPTVDLKIFIFLTVQEIENILCLTLNYVLKMYMTFKTFRFITERWL